MEMAGCLERSDCKGSKPAECPEVRRGGGRCSGGLDDDGDGGGGEKADDIRHEEGPPLSAKPHDKI